MAGGSLLTLLDDIATVLDDIAVMTKVATKKTAGVLGDDLALNAQQVTGVAAERELPVVWAVAKGSLKNKVILIPAALLISAFIPWAITPLLMLGGAFLCFEGCEKLAHKFFHSPAEDEAHHAELTRALIHPEIDMVALEKEKIKGAIRTDFVLSAEIIVISLGAAAAMSLTGQLGVLVAISLIMTVGVYGLVAAIVKLDDGGLYLNQKVGEDFFARFQRGLGAGILRAAPWLMKALSVIGTAAMFMVGGGILVHGLPFLHHWLEAIPVDQQGVVGALVGTLFNAIVGIIIGALVLLVVTAVQRIFKR
jgi:predicted DNA repair protein MutK